MGGPKHYIPIWFFIGALLLLYGVLITATGIYHYFEPPDNPVALFHLHAGIWWGALLIALGALYCYFFRPGRG